MGPPRVRTRKGNTARSERCDVQIPEALTGGIDRRHRAEMGTTMGTSTQVTLDSRTAAKVEAEALVSYVFESEKDGKAVEGAIAELDQAAGGALAKLAAAGELTGKMLEFTLVHFAPGIAAQRVVLVGAGKREKFGTAELRRIASAA